VLGAFWNTVFDAGPCQFTYQGAIMAVIVWLLDLKLLMQSVPITTCYLIYPNFILDHKTIFSSDKNLLTNPKIGDVIQNIIQ
jgi:hypothetical protein